MPGPSPKYITMTSLKTPENEENVYENEEMGCCSRAIGRSG